ncbi:aspartate 1-decarboxylase [Nitrospinae bacterium]|jgi:aspartate 1-decarboxylase|nr:aspartate 1-decarboxylase [Nitrospinota bacterium]
MQRIMLKSKLHRARVTATEIDYEGSIAIDEDLLDRVDIIPLEQVHIFNINSGARFITYVIKAERGSGIFSINGAAARLAQINDRIIVAAYGMIDTDKEKHNAQVILLNESNRVVEG